MILMDGSLPFLDGLDATRRIRENGLRDQVKILALDGWGTPSYHAAALAAGCDDSIKKPLDFDRLRKYLAPLFDTSSHGAEAIALSPKLTLNLGSLTQTVRLDALSLVTEELYRSPNPEIGIYCWCRFEICVRLLQIGSSG